MCSVEPVSDREWFDLVSGGAVGEGDDGLQMRDRLVVAHPGDF